MVKESGDERERGAEWARSKHSKIITTHNRRPLNRENTKRKPTLTFGSTDCSFPTMDWTICVIRLVIRFPVAWLCLCFSISFFFLWACFLFLSAVFVAKLRSSIGGRFLVDFLLHQSVSAVKRALHTLRTATGCMAWIKYQMENCKHKSCQLSFGSIPV